MNKEEFKKELSELLNKYNVYLEILVDRGITRSLDRHVIYVSERKTGEELLELGAYFV